MHQHVQHDRGAAQMRHPVLADRGEDRGGFDPAQADMGPADRGHRPGIGPAVAMEHRQGPQIDQIAVEPKGDRIAERIQKRAAMVVDDTLRVAGGARSVVERDSGPLVGGAAASPRPGRLRRESPRIRCSPSGSPPDKSSISTNGSGRPSASSAGLTIGANSRSAISNFASPCAEDEGDRAAHRAE